MRNLRDVEEELDRKENENKTDNELYEIDRLLGLTLLCIAIIAFVLTVKFLF